MKACRAHGFGLQGEHEDHRQRQCVQGERAASDQHTGQHSRRHQKGALGRDGAARQDEIARPGQQRADRRRPGRIKTPRPGRDGGEAKAQNQEYPAGEQGHMHARYCQDMTEPGRTQGFTDLGGEAGPVTGQQGGRHGAIASGQTGAQMPGDLPAPARDSAGRCVLVEGGPGFERRNRETAADNAGEIGVETKIITARHRRAPRPFQNGENTDRGTRCQLRVGGEDPDPARRSSMLAWQADGETGPAAAIALDRFQPTGHLHRPAIGQRHAGARTERVAAMLGPRQTGCQSQQGQRGQAQGRTAGDGTRRQQTGKSQYRQGCSPQGGRLEWQVEIDGTTGRKAERGNDGRPPGLHKDHRGCGRPHAISGPGLSHPSNPPCLTPIATAGNHANKRYSSCSAA